MGRWLKEKWRLDALLGVGGVGSVYAATHRNQSRVAIKILRAELASEPDLVARFLHEGYAANAVGHSGVVRVLDDDKTDDGLVFLVMELLEGETLEARTLRRGGRLPVDEALAVADGVLAVLEAAHAKSVIHRDLKPENVFLCRDGTVKVLDFGIARVRAGTPPPRSGTQHGWMMGTPGYMPPEQVRGQWDRVDARSDLWAVGATLHALLTGRRVHESAGAALDVFSAATRPAPSLAEARPDLPPAVIALVDRALRSAPEERWSSATEMRAALAAALPTGSPSAPLRANAPTLTAGAVTGGTSLIAPAPAPSRVGPPDNTQPIAIAPDTFWVGKRDPKSIFHANPFLRIFPGAAPYNLIVDPGSSSDFSVVSAKVGTLLGRVGALSGMFINHQDPDVGSSAARISGRYAPDASIFCSEATWRLVVHFNLPRDRFVDVDGKRRGITLPGGHEVIPVPSPFCHFRGAVMLYDPATRVLFSGDLLGGITEPGERDLWADEGDWSGIRAFHQLYMPTNRAIAAAARAIQRLDPFPEIIAPQHGRLLRGAVLRRFLERLEHLPVGLDILDDVGEGADALAAWSSALNRVLHTARLVLGDEVDRLLAHTSELEDCCTFRGERAAVTSAGRWALGTAVRLLTEGRSPTIANPIRLEAVHACEDLELPSPDLMLEGEQSIVASSG
ncbi:beta-lactamase domain protein [Minicystis rosea]|nr:beta-lactamase domain protein [Minicystis rosea]